MTETERVRELEALLRRAREYVRHQLTRNPHAQGAQGLHRDIVNALAKEHTHDAA